MKVSIYSTAFNLGTPRGASFDVLGAMSNWDVYADEISVACGDDESSIRVQEAAVAAGVRDKLKVTRTSFDFTSDSYAYGRTENAALQACTGDLLIQQNMDERIRVDKVKLEVMHDILNHQSANGVAAFWVPTIDLYGSHEQCLPSVNKKWYVSRPGLYRGPVRFGIKDDGRPCYDRTSTDELIDQHGNLVPTVSLLDDYSVDSLKPYVAHGWPLVYHLGYVSLTDRLERSLWWKAFWERASGDPNQHPTSVEEMARKQTVVHGLPLWPLNEGTIAGVYRSNADTTITPTVNQTHQGL